MKRHEQAEAVLNRFFAECGDAMPSQAQIAPVLDRVWGRLQWSAGEFVDAQMPAAPARPFRFAWAAAMVLVAVSVSVLVWNQGPPFASAGKNEKANEFAKSSAGQARETLQIAVPQDAFDLVSVKLLPPSSDLVKRANQFGALQLAMTGCDAGYIGRVQLDPGRLTIDAIAVFSLITIAYGQDCTLVEGGPAWARSGDLYEITALLPAGAPGYTTQDLQKGKAPRLQGMLQNLLTDRFRLVLKREVREMSVYALTVASRGRMTLASADEIRPAPVSLPSFPGAPPLQLRRGDMASLLTISGEVQMAGHALSMADLAKELRGHAGRIIVDKTGLNEVFDVDLKFLRDTVPNIPPPPGAPIPPAPPSPQSIPPLPVTTLPGPPSLRTALEEQLGLKLESVRMPIEVLIIERVEKPSEN